MDAFSYLGNEYSFLLLLPVLYWCIKAGIGLRVGDRHPDYSVDQSFPPVSGCPLSA
jgi:hypothetical protein